MALLDFNNVQKHIKQLIPHSKLRTSDCLRRVAITYAAAYATRETVYAAQKALMDEFGKPACIAKSYKRSTSAR